jgi:uncharacterized protein (TIGR02145 family)
MLSDTGKYQGWYRLTGPTGYDIKQTQYDTAQVNPDYTKGRSNERTPMSTSGNYYTVETVAGMEGSTITYNWEIVRNNTENHAYLGNRQDSSTVELIFGNGILSKAALVGKPRAADTIVLQCSVYDGIETYELQRTITVGDRDECSPTAGLLDAEGNSYTVSRFGGVCWMTQNLRSTWTKQGNQVQIIPEGTNVDNSSNAVIYYYPNGNNINSPDQYGLLYTWGAANIGTVTTEATDAFRNTTSDRQGICPDGWTLPSDYDWNQLEKEIAINPRLYSPENTTLDPAWKSEYESATVWRPGSSGTTPPWWGRRMKSPTAVSGAGATGGVSNTDGTGFNALLVGYHGSTSNSFGVYTFFHSSSVSDATNAWRRYLHNTVPGAGRDPGGKSSMISVRCKK